MALDEVCADLEVFPTRVGVFLIVDDDVKRELGLPHASGGVSGYWAASASHYLVFPTRVGVFLWVRHLAVLGIGLPHASGGVS